MFCLGLIPLNVILNLKQPLTIQSSTKVRFSEAERKFETRSEISLSGIGMYTKLRKFNRKYVKSAKKQIVYKDGLFFVTSVPIASLITIQ